MHHVAPSRMLHFLFCIFLTALSAAADGLQDNLTENVRRIPKEGINVPPDRAASMQSQLKLLQGLIVQLRELNQPDVTALLPDVMIFERGVRCALDYREFFDVKDLDKADELLKEGLSRANQLLAGNPSWPGQSGLIVRGYISRIDNTVQPYGLLIPDTAPATGSAATRCDIWFHGRGEVLSEVNFLWEHMHSAGTFTPAHTIVLHPYGRYCNAFKFAGEVDVLEALEDVQRRYWIDEDRISVRGFSMGGAACWQFATHYADRWFAASPGAGFSETPEFLKFFQKEELHPTPWEQTLWNMYDCNRWAGNLSHCPTIAYSGEEDIQKQAADIMETALATRGIPLRHIIGAKMGHRYDEPSKVAIETGMSQLAKIGRNSLPASIEFTTYSLKYNRMHWVTVDAMDEHWKQAALRVDIGHADADEEDEAEKTEDASEDDIPGAVRITVSPENVAAFTLRLPAGQTLIDRQKALTANGPGVQILVVVTELAKNPDGTAAQPERHSISCCDLHAAPPFSDGSFEFSAHKDDQGYWVAGRQQEGDGLRKRHGLQGPVDDAMMDSFVFVRPTGKSHHDAAGRWVDAELNRAVEHWRRHFRGDARVVNDTEVTDELIQSAHLILWGDPSSSQILAKIADRLPIRWTADAVTAGDKAYESAHHVPILIYPNPLNPNRYVVLNSSFTFRDFAYLNNARQVSMLPDWAIIDLRTPPGNVWPGRVVAADFFDEEWQLKKTQPSQ